MRCPTGAELSESESFLMQDKVITKFEARFKDAQAEAHEVTAELAEERRRADGADARVAELLEQRAKTRRLQERQLAEAAGLQASLRADVSAARVWQQCLTQMSALLLDNSAPAKHFIVRVPQHRPKLSLPVNEIYPLDKLGKH